MSQLTIVYDEECGFCLRALGWIQRRDRAQRFAAIGCRSDERRQRFPDLAEAACLDEMYLVEADGRRLGGGDAAAAILRRLPPYGLLGALLGAPILRLATRAGYRLIARNRHRLGCDSRRCEL